VKAAPDISQDRIRFDDLAPGVARIAGIAGIAGLAAAVVLALIARSAETFLRGYVVAYAFIASLVLFALVFVALQHLTRAGWSVVIRRLAENISMAFPLLGLLALPIVVPIVTGWPGAIHAVYPWTDAELVAHDHLLHGKAAYLSVGPFIVRILLYFAIWIWLSRFFYTNSVAQDRTGDPGLTSRMQGLSAPAAILYALTTSFFAVDLLMSLQPHWFSTIFGFYYISGSAVGFFATVAIALFLLQRAGRVQAAVTTEHFHDVGKFMFGFTVFWAYIGFSQYMLIWYASLPEETMWYDMRQKMPWLVISFILLFGHFVVPFLLMISRYPKRRPNLLILGAAWMLLMHWVDMFWLVFPRYVDPHAPAEALAAAPLTLWDVLVSLAATAGVGGLILRNVVIRMGQTALIPERDPRLGESLAFENY